MAAERQMGTYLLDEPCFARLKEGRKANEDSLSRKAPAIFSGYCAGGLD